MTSPGRDWNEVHLAENPAVDLLEGFGYTYVPPEQLDTERESYHDVILTGRLSNALKRLNPWISSDNIQKAVRTFTHVSSASLIEASEKLYTALTYGISLEQERGDGTRSHSVRFVDFEHPSANDLLATRQFKVKGAKKHIIADVVVFVNGIPLVVIECKSPTLGDKWLHEGVDQLLRYQEASNTFRGIGAPRLFETAQILVATCGEASRYGTILTPQRFYLEWKEPYPRSLEVLEDQIGRKPKPQEILFYGILTPENLLDIVRNFIVYERDLSSGQTIRKLCRYPQFMAVNKAIHRARAARRPEERGGVVWHTQGSGKSLSMLWLALKLRRDPVHENPTIVIVTDRLDLDDQISRTFRNCGFPNPDRANSVRHLRELLSGSTGKTIMTTIQKFMELTGTSTDGNERSNRAEHPVLSTAKNVFVLTDEAHRTQYGGLAGNMRQALPNACFLGFTGTPIDKNDRSTLRTFGPYIDTYTIEQSVADGATVPIFYESRLPEVRIVGQTLDKIFDRVFSDRSELEREAIKQRYATEATIACAPKRIEEICQDLIEHYESYVQPNGFKAQVVTVNREAAVTYKETLDRLNAPQSAVVISGTNDDHERLVRHHTSLEEKKDIIRRFLDPNARLSILVVCDMLLTGFDAPVEQVMYLDSPLKEHALLQAIARVNRPCGDKKTYGLIVDYWGVSEALQEALAIFSPKDVKGAMNPKGDELPRLQTRHATVLKFFNQVRNRNDLEACVTVLDPEDVRADFNLAFRRFAQSMDMLLPDPRALPYLGDLKWLGKIRGVAAARYRDATIDVSDCGEKVRRLIDESVAADGINVLVQKVALFTKEFDEKVDALKGDEAKASEMEHAIRAEIHVRIDENPAFYTSLRERLEEIVEKLRQRRIDAARQLDLLRGIYADLQNEAGAAEKLGLTETGFAIYGVLGETAGKVRDVEPGRCNLAGLIEDAVEPHIEIVDWTHKEDTQRELRRSIKRKLRDAGYPEDRVDPLAVSIVELLKVRAGQR